MYTVGDLYFKYKEGLNLKLLSNNDGFKNKIKKPEVQRAGLTLSGHIKNYKSYRILILGRSELIYLKVLDSKTRKKRLETISKNTPCIIVTYECESLKELMQICEKASIALFQTNIDTMSLITKLIINLNNDFAPSITVHGTLVEVFGIGVLIKGDSSAGKSEAALGLLERGHRLVTDDVVVIKKKNDNTLIGSGPKHLRHMMEVRGIGIINVAHLYGAICFREKKVLDLVIELEQWNDTHYYDRVGLNDKFIDILKVRLPIYLLPVKPGRDVVLLIETLTLNHRLKINGYNSANAFNVKLLNMITKRKINSFEIKKNIKSKK